MSVDQRGSKQTEPGSCQLLPPLSPDRTLSVPKAKAKRDAGYEEQTPPWTRHPLAAANDEIESALDKPDCSTHTGRWAPQFIPHTESTVSFSPKLPVPGSRRCLQRPSVKGPEVLMTAGLPTS